MTINNLLINILGFFTVGVKKQDWKIISWSLGNVKAIKQVKTSC